jgi:hypothetical protein
MKMASRTLAAFAIASCFLFSSIYAGHRQKNSSPNGSNGLNHFLTSGFSKKRIVETAADHNGSLLFKRWKTTPDTVHVVAIRIEFNKGQPDTSPSTTGNGLFGILNGKDKKETTYYNSDTVYKYDALPHDSSYFDKQLQFLRTYYSTVSHGNLYVDYSIFPTGADENKAYILDSSMVAYGPGDKRKEETYAQFNNRINVKLLKFVRDAITRANTDITNGSPFKGLRADGSGTIVDSLGHRTVFLIIHAGSSYLTDGGKTGTRDSPFDMIDAFITKDYLAAYKDTLKLDTLKGSAGILVKGGGDSAFLIDEIMMTSETSNQDGLNFGIHGILVNQLARQLGIPDLYSTSSGTTAIGAFCIMDFYGYSAGQGFIPPWPSAWVRAFMGWETPVVIPMGTPGGGLNLKAVCLGKPGDTTIALVPLNDHEYYLIENRQRSLVGGPSIFAYDTTDNHIYIDKYFPLNLDNNVLTTSPGSRAILTVKNFDASLPASGAVVWHIDENIIRDRLKYDFLNADSSYRAVSMVEADGINDIGFEFQNGFYQLFFDFGGAEDVFPHRTVNRKTPAGKDSTFSINAMGPWSKPSTQANDGGQTYLNLTFDTLHAQGTEVSAIHDSYYVNNYIDSVFRLTVNWDYLVSGWPKRMVSDSGEGIFDPVTCDLYKANSGKEVVALSKKGRLYVWPATSDSTQPSWFGDTIGTAALTGSINTALTNSISSIPSDTVSLDTVHFFQLKNPGRPFTFPTVINNRLFIPLLDTAIDIIRGVSKTGSTHDRLDGAIVPLRFQPSSYVCKLEGNYWAVGCNNGTVFLADTANYYTDTAAISLSADTPSAVCAVAALAREPNAFVCIQNNAILSLCSIKSKSVIRTRKVPKGIPPFSIVTGDINHDDTNEIVVCDSRKGLWMFNHDLTPALGWESAPNDWASPYDTAHDRHALAVNLAPPSLADLNGDGRLEIIAGGSNGLYALNYKGVPISGWPSYLDNRFFHGNVSSSPAIVAAPQGAQGPLVLFSSPSGENMTFQIDKIVSADKKTGKVFFKRPDGSIDTTYAAASFIDSAITSGDSLIATVALYGGLIDAVNPSGRRPLRTIGSNQLYSRWPLTVGASIGTSPLIDDIKGDGNIDLVAAGSNGWVYQWKLDADMAGKSILWKQTGYDGSRPFAYLAAPDSNKVIETAPLSLFSYPNPTNGSKAVTFAYKFSSTAKNVRLDIFTYTGFHVFSTTALSGSYPDWNYLTPVSLTNFGSGVYRCRMEAEVNGKKYVQYWKMAVVK